MIANFAHDARKLDPDQRSMHASTPLTGLQSSFDCIPATDALKYSAPSLSAQNNFIVNLACNVKSIRSLLKMWKIFNELFVYGKFRNCKKKMKVYLSSVRKSFGGAATYWHSKSYYGHEQVTKMCFNGNLLLTKRV